MCGIAGRFDVSGLSRDAAWAPAADRLLAHRGPDGSGHFADPYCELVHRRLAIVDLSPSGEQPMTNEDGNVLLIFNGEIFNYRELRAELQERGHVLRGTSDTECLVHLWEDRGERLVEALRGQFAFALYDRRRRCLLLGRDRFGIKPLYYARHGSAIVFASEIKALLALQGFEPRLDRQACYDYLSLGYVPEPATGYANVAMLEKATTLLVDAEGEHPRSYYSLQARPVSRRCLDDVADEVGAALTESVRLQSLADVPVAAMLSGGIDSSLIVAAYCRSTSSPPLTFNVGFPEAGYDETSVAEAVAKHYGTRHQVVTVGERLLDPDSVLELLAHFDQPFADTSLFPTYLVNRAIRDAGIKCTVSGDGGDEAFGGYARFWRANTLSSLMRLPQGAQSLLAAAARAAVPFTQDWGRQVDKAVRLARAGARDASQLIAGLSSYLPDAEKESLVDPGSRAGLQPVARLFEARSPVSENGLEGLSLQMTENLFALSLPSDMLRKVDVMSMRASVEVRVPLLDERVVELGLGLTHALKTNGHEGKLVLRALARRWLPRRVAEHPKHGFSIPMDVLADDSLHAMLEDSLLSPASRVRAFVDAKRVGDWLQRFRRAMKGEHGHGMSREGLYRRIFILLALEIWLRRTKLSW